MKPPFRCHAGKHLQWVARSLLVSFLVVQYGFCTNEMPGVFRCAKNHMVGLVDRHGNLVVEPRFEGCSRGWSEEFLLVVRTVNEIYSANFIDESGRELLDQPMGQYWDREMALIPGFSQGVTQVELANGKLVVVNRSGIIGEATRGWDNEVVPVRIGSRFVYKDVVGTRLFEIDADEALPFMGESAPIMKDGKWGLVGKSGDLLLRPTFDRINFTEDRRHWIVVTAGKCGIVRNDGTWLVLPVLDSYKKWRHNVIAFSQDGRMGVLDATDGKVLVEPSFDDIDHLGATAAWMQRDGAWGLVQYDGTVIQPFAYSAVKWASAADEFWAVEKDNCIGIVSDKGHSVLPCAYMSIDRPRDRFASVQSEAGYGLFDLHDEAMVIMPKFDRIICWPGLSGKVAMVESSRKWGMARLSDEKLLLPTEHDLLRQWNALIEARTGDLIALFDSEGNAVLPWSVRVTELPSMYNGFVNGFGKIVCKNQAGLIDEHGTIALACRYQDVGRYSDGLVPAKKDGQWGFVNLEGEWIIQPQYANAHAFLNGLAAVQRNGKYGFIDMHGRMKIPFSYQDAGYAYNDRMPVAQEKGGKVFWGLIDTSGETVLPIEYECVEWVDLGPEPTRYHGPVTWKVY